MKSRRRGLVPSQDRGLGGVPSRRRDLRVRDVRSDEIPREYSHLNPNPNAPSPKRTLCRPNDQPALRSLTLHSFIFNANEMNTFAHAMMKNVQIQNADSKLDVCGQNQTRHFPASKEGASMTAKAKELGVETACANTPDMNKKNGLGRSWAEIVRKTVPAPLPSGKG